MDWLIISSDYFDKKAYKYDIPDNRIDSISKELKINPFVGKPLGYNFLREKKYDDKRIYYLIYEDIKTVLLVSISDKKTQQETIEAIKHSFDEFKKLAIEISEKVRKEVKL